LLELFFDPEDGGNMFLRNVDWLSPDYTTVYPSHRCENLRSYKESSHAEPTIYTELSLSRYSHQPHTTQAIITPLIRSHHWTLREDKLMSKILYSLS
jgi:hypothetical protein